MPATLDFGLEFLLFFFVICFVLIFPTKFLVSWPLGSGGVVQDRVLK